MTQHFKVEAKSRQNPASTTTTQIITAIAEHLRMAPADRERPSATAGMQEIMRLIAERYRAKPFNPSEQVRLKKYIDSVAALANKYEILHPVYQMLNLMLELPYAYQRENEEKMHSPFDNQTTKMAAVTFVTLSKENKEKLLEELRSLVPDSKAIAQILTGVTELNIAGERVNANGIFALIAALKNNQILRKLNIGANTIDARSIQSLAKLLKSNHSITHLSLSSAYITEEHMLPLAEALKSNNTLTTFWLTYNQIGSIGAQMLVETLSCNHTLKHLFLGWNSINDAGVLSLAEILKDNRTLKTLDLQGNNICDEGAVALAAMLEGNCVLRTLDLGRNPIAEVGQRAFTAAFTCNDTLTALVLERKGMDVKVFQNFRNCEDRNSQFQEESREKYERDLFLAIEQSLEFMPGTELIAGYVGKAVPIFTKKPVDVVEEIKRPKTFMSATLAKSIRQSGVLTSAPHVRAPLDMPFINAVLTGYAIVAGENSGETIIELDDKISLENKFKIRDQLMTLFAAQGLRATAGVNRINGFIVLEAISPEMLKSLVTLPTRPQRFSSGCTLS